ncbi:hypothetical protein CWATWH8502_4018 [Crocosphaera watsonii WH 8502]|uniref:Uncharacterized protein n=4 Tax=Crocosphaera watsonii TaxID=263511 RepID=T2JMN4_CROWT|nr:hypothetical protein CWATWH8502_4018 [Crocosphaera watsonii WH 8502]CCQ56244.1 hypothetical protein CWATWH0005_948 [Crocosphaera watsonii WH 0005]CCQ61947.1 hypothetical protein CWATWH0401_4312 [Crocosphaera watsonii WH 0401]CCQ66520.1 hypothetical protein CWATWH0402_2344 [Crocosphaera watsonii WH 0402]
MEIFPLFEGFLFRWEHPKVANSPLLIIVDMMNFPPSHHLLVKLHSSRFLQKWDAPVTLDIY